MIPRLNISFPLKRQWLYWFGTQYEPSKGEYLLNHARTGIVLALRASIPDGGRVGVVAYNCHTVANAVAKAGCTPVFVDVTDELKVDIVSLPSDLDGIVVTNLFGIRNDISAIRKRCPNAVIIVDNAHGYGLPAEGDFTVYSINQGKFPALGEGGILISNSEFQMDESYSRLPAYGFVAQVNVFLLMLIKAMLYSPCLYWLVRKGKKKVTVNPRQNITLRRMAPGIRRMYQSALPTIEKQIEQQRTNAIHVAAILRYNDNVEGVFFGENAFMAIARCKEHVQLQEDFHRLGIETATHFANAIEWAKQFGYTQGQCPKTEYMVKHLLMIPTYCQLQK